MEKCNKKNKNHIKSIIQNKTGVHLVETSTPNTYAVRKYAIVACCLLCFLSLSAFTYYKFNSLSGDDLALTSVYQGDGKYEIIITNLSDHELKLQKHIQVMQWSTGEPVDGNPDCIRVECSTIQPKSTGVVKVDISEGYNIESMKENMKEGDWYYFILTNSNFAFGQDWMCSFGFEIEKTEVAMREQQTFIEQMQENNSEREPEYEPAELIFDDWALPASPFLVSGYFGEQVNGSYSDHINIAGNEGDPVFAVYDGTIEKVGFDPTDGNYVVLVLEDGTVVTYGHLKEIKVSEGDLASRGAEIATMGKTGMATGVNLSFAVTVEQENTNPIK